MTKRDLEVKGAIAALTEGRLVFLGKDLSGQTTALFVAFRNAQGDDTKLSLSPEAVDALVDLRHKQINGFAGSADFPHKRIWKVVPDSGIDK